MTNRQRADAARLAVAAFTHRTYGGRTPEPEDFHAEDGVYVRFARVELRTDSLVTARARARRYGVGHRTRHFAVIVDLTTGEEV